MAIVSELTPARAHAANGFDQCAARNGRPGVHAAAKITTVQINIGLTCNLVCRHCHVNSSPRRKEQMDWETLEAVLAMAEALNADTIDITGGAPEMNPHFRRFVPLARARGFRIMVRTNLSIALQEGYEDLPQFFREHGVALVASLPCYLEENVDAQRGAGVYEDSIEVIRRLNAEGFGIDPALSLSLIYNPLGPTLPPEQDSLEADYRRELRARHGIEFTRLHTITNMPIGRFRADLRKQKELDRYASVLREAFNPDTVEPLMCRHQIHVGWDGTLHDCDFNFALGLKAGLGERANVRDVDVESLKGRRIVTGSHCYACTAGAGSSCGGVLV